MLLQAALNGTRSRDDHHAVPETPDALAEDALDCVRAGAALIHLHPRDAMGQETLDPRVVDAVVRRVREACGVPVGVSTGAWIEPDPERRAMLISQWHAPDFASVNLSEEGAAEVMAACSGAGIGIEAGIWSVDDVERLDAYHGDHLIRVLVELIDLDPGEAARRAQAIHGALDRAGIDAPRLQHGEGRATWPMLDDALERGLETRIGLEDTLEMPDGSPAESNAALVVAVTAVSA